MDMTPEQVQEFDQAHADALDRLRAAKQFILFATDESPQEHEGDDDVPVYPIFAFIQCDPSFLMEASNLLSRAAIKVFLQDRFQFIDEIVDGLGDDDD